MNSNEFCFGILAYNQEKEIVNTLNSIKFQIIKYGHNYKNNLIIVDDFSKDNTLKICEEWINKNRNIFNNIFIKKNEENLGVVENYNFILDKIIGSNFKIIAGDDLISNNDIYTISDFMDRTTLLCGIKFSFQSDKLVVDDKTIYQQFYLINAKLNVKKIFRLFKLGFIISTPQTLYSKFLYENSNAKEINSKFRLFEDNPTWYSMFKNCKKLNVRFIDKPIALYRLSEKSISNSHTELNKKFMAELNNLYNIYIKDGDAFDKIYFKSLMKKNRYKITFSKIINKIIFIYFKLYSFIQFRKFRKFKESILEEYKIEQEYLETILKENS